MDYSDDGIESGEENLYSDVEVEDNEIDYGFADEEDIKGSQKGYVVLKEEDILKHQKKDIESVSTGLSISQAEAIALLLHYHWRVSKVEDEWFTDEERIRETVGILKEPVVDVNGKKEIQCGICFESYTRGEIARVSCGHPYCNTCWTGYVTSKIGDGSGCLRVACPEPSCSAAVGQDMIDKFSKKEDKEKYYRYLLRSYVEEDVVGRIKWCPSPECECAIDFGVGGSGSSCYDITCSCSHSFCWNCREDAHSPVDCETVSKWIFKTQDEGENKNWMLVNSKSCPKCKRPIEKNKGCNHMTCSSPCGYEFCWVCLEAYTGHGACNRFVEEADEDKRKLLKDEMGRYMHYYERWLVNQLSRLTATSDLEKWQSVQLKQLSGTLGKPKTELEFIVEAWRQIIECRRVLKWTYAYGYYLPNHETGKKKFFEYLQSDAESGLERLHRCAETELKEFIHKSDDPTNGFHSFKIKLTDLTRATKTFFENLVKALENGLSDVVCSGETKSTEETGMRLYDHMIFSTQFSHEWVDDEWLDDYVV